MIRTTQKIVLVQAVAASLVSAAMGFSGGEDVRAALWASVVVVVPNAYFEWRVSQERDARRVIALGVAKMLVTLIALAVVLKVVGPSPLGFFTALTVVLLAHAVGAAWTQDGYRGGVNGRS